MTKEQRQWIEEATDFCVAAKQKQVLILLATDDVTAESLQHQVVVTNAQTPAQICWLMRAINGEESGNAEPANDEASE